MTGAFTSAIKETLDEHAPLVARRKRGRRICPWLTEELVSAVRHRNRLHHRLMKDQANEVLREQHRLARAFARKLDRKLRNLYFVNQCNTPDQRKLWSAMNAVTGRRKERQIPQVSVEDLGQVFGEIVNDPSRPQNLHPPLGPMPANSLHVFKPVSVADVEKCLKAVDPFKAAGSDSAPGIVLRQCANVLAPPLSCIINSSLQSGVVPTTFKHSHISPLHKAGDRSSARNYRPVSLLPIVSRILGQFVKRQLTEYLYSNELYPMTQFAYRPRHSTEDALVLAVNRWLLAKSERKYTGLVMIDMSKAFDRVQHERLV